MLEFSALITVPADHPCLAGHFPGRPVVPAVLLLELVVETLGERIGEIAVPSLPAVKFLKPVLPGQALEMNMRVDAQAGRAWFVCTHAGEAAARGELRYSAPARKASGAA